MCYKKLKIFVWIFFVLNLLLEANECSIPFEILGPEAMIEDSQLIIEQGKSGIEKLMGKKVTDLCPELLSTYEDTIVEDDILNITVYHPTRIDWMLSIKDWNEARGGVKVIHGKVSLPGIEPISVEGMTLEEARQEIRSQLRQEIKNTDVFVTYRERNSNTVELTGFAMRKVIPIDGKVRLLDVLSTAHIPPEASLFGSYVMREGKFLNVDLNRLIKHGDMCQNIVMKGGDKIFIASPSDHFAIIVGEVVSLMTRPLQDGYNFRAIHLPSGYVSLREALIHAHGIPYSSCKNYVHVIRSGIPSMKIFVIPWKAINNEPNNHLLLIPGDLVYISLEPISNWKVFIDEISVTLLLAPFAHFIHNVSK